MRTAPCKAATYLALALLLLPVRAWGWGSDGHKIVAVIAADNLTPAAQSHVANILGVHADKRAIASAMEAAAVLPDSKFREEDHTTKPWHFIDICLRDTPADIARRCPGGNCVTDKIDEYSTRLRQRNYDKWRADGDLAFVIHFVGDIHQPLHAANDADRGGNCIKVDSHPRAEDLHYAWDTTIVRQLEFSIDSGRPETTARRLEQKYAAEKAADPWIAASAIAWESNQLARTEIYTPLNIPIESCESLDALCRTEPEVPLSAAYMDRAEVIAGHQLAKAGFRLASLLNEIWTQPDDPNDGVRGDFPSGYGSIESSTGQIVGNRRSKIYAWPGCASYNTMAPQNRVEFPSRAAAEQAGYRAAYNCP